MLRLYFLVFCLNIICASSAYAEDVVVIVNKNSSLNKLTRKEVVDVFLGRKRTDAILPMDFPIDAVERDQFYSRLTGKSSSEMNSYWARLKFTGRATPPTLMKSRTEAEKMLNDNLNAVTYMFRKNINSSLKVIFEVKEY